ncbi:MAG: hypothetical protein ACI8QZ_002496 [Chlamydiales bacterium]|jgi:hypothetical protein
MGGRTPSNSGQPHNPPRIQLLKFIQLSIPTVALAAVFAVSLSTDSTGFSKLGTQLNGAQRDFRVFNNFTTPSANNNTVIHPSFPGYDGAELAIWKACIEWGSLTHGDGEGDTHQPGGLGSGGANFDASFQGNANGVGDTNSNIHSQISGSGGGVLAFAEGPANNGWRIRYYENINWQDGPAPISSGFDLQSVACHEYGHAVGMGHSGSGLATMAPSIGSGSERERSIHADDIAGLQCVYGVATIGVKPIITTLNEVGNVLTITGQNFDATNNTVWFTQAASGGTGDPVNILNAGSTSGGTVITVNVPAAAGPGDVLVKNQALGGSVSVSNAQPYDPSPVPPCPPPTNFCVGAPHSAGAGAFMAIDGSQQVPDNNFSVEVYQAPPDKFGLFFYGPSQIQVVFGDGFRCVGGMTKRLPVVQTDFLGYAFYTLNLATLPDVGVGDVQNFQFWFRDPMGPGGTGFNLSDGIEVEFCP